MPAATTTGQNIIDAASQDVRHLLGSGDATLLLDYVDRVHRDIIRDRRHPFLLSEPKFFVTEKGVSNYGIGVTPPVGCWDTGLALDDLGTIQYVYNRSIDKELGREDHLALTSQNYPDGTSPYGAPTRYLYHENTPTVMRLFDVPDNAVTFVPVAPGPIVTTAVSGALAARTYFVKMTLVDASGGESVAGPTARVYIPANSVLKVKSPTLNYTASGALMTYPSYRVYASTIENSEALQSTVAFASDYTETGSGLSAGALAPASSTLEPLRGYLIEFRYFKKLTAISSPSTVLQIPDDYRDVVVAGTNAFAYLYLKSVDEATIWKNLYDNGKQDIRREANNNPPEADFMRPGR